MSKDCEITNCPNMAVIEKHPESESYLCQDHHDELTHQGRINPVLSAAQMDWEGRKIRATKTLQRLFSITYNTIGMGIDWDEVKEKEIEVLVEDLIGPMPEDEE